MSSCVSHHHHTHHIQPRALAHHGGRLLAPASFAPLPVPRRRQRRVELSAMSAEAAPGVEPAETEPAAAAAAAEWQQEVLLAEMVEDVTVWCAVHGLVIEDRVDLRSGTVPGVSLVHASFSLLPARLLTSFWKQACELAPIFNELVDRVSLDGEFLQAALSRTKQVDEFTARLLEIHEKMMAINKKEDIHLGLHCSDYMLDSETNSLLQIELNTISSSFPGLGFLVSELHSFTCDVKQRIMQLIEENSRLKEQVTRTARMEMQQLGANSEVMYEEGLSSESVTNTSYPRPLVRHIAQAWVSTDRVLVQQNNMKNVGD